jgi:glutamate dehydrogenase
VAAAVAVRAAHVAWEVLEMRRLWSGVAALDGRVDDTLQQQMLSSGVRLVARSCRWLLKNSEVAQDIAGTIERYRQGIAQLSSHLPELVQSAPAEALQAQASGLQEAGAPAELARWVAGFDTLSRAFDIVEVAEACRRQVSEAARGYFLLGADLELDWLASKIAALPTQDRWLVGARVALRDELLEHHRTLCIDLLLAEPIEGTAEARLAGWKQRNQTALEAWLRLLAELKTHAESQVAMLSVALQSIRKLVRAASAK